MFKEIVEKKHYSFHEGFDDWRDAVRAACAPLLADGTIEKEYPEIIIEKVEELGPYIVIAPNICIPHAERGRGVNDTAMCFMKTERKLTIQEGFKASELQLIFPFPESPPPASASPATRSAWRRRTTLPTSGPKWGRSAVRWNR